MRTDLKLSGDCPEYPAYAVRFIAYAELRSFHKSPLLLQMIRTSRERRKSQGVYLDELLAALNISGKNILIAAICDDEYEGHYSVEYRAVHHPILVLRVNGKQLALSKRKVMMAAMDPI